VSDIYYQEEDVMMKMKHMLLTASAVALIAGTQAVAQGQNSSRPPTTPQAAPTAPAEKSAPGVPAPSGTLNNAPGQSGDATGNDTKRPGNAQMDRSPAQRSGEAAGERKSNDTAASPSKDRNEASGERNRSGASKTDRNRNEAAGEKRGGTAATKDDGMNAQASAPVKLSTEQRTKITTVIKEKNVQPTKVNFDIHVGATVPRSVHLVTLPTEVIEVYPAWRGYEFILVGNDIIVINPNTFRVVAVIPA
jgi:hypothetical protein